ncbi:SET domain-containing protein-lysine N-methyltransferase [Hyalangium versicolor]|uniref:SET domain-containing protein-lysine N-methyltransferase n=1 Tax=Hyalangium versicolor TaxID=2861190 RepID=UPI001CCF0246|nr:SET domain-containing protein-lysine N-methyltransferase [Hyalangium versicolor]
MNEQVSQDESPQLAVRRNEQLGQQYLESLRAFATGDTISAFRAKATHARPSRMTLQVSEHEHIELTPPALSFTNHSCDPNVYFDVEKWALSALRPIAAGDALTYFYPSTEWTMASPFECLCGSPRCLRRIAGASQMPKRALQGYRLAPHITKLLEESSMPKSLEPRPLFDALRSGAPLPDFAPEAVEQARTLAADPAAATPAAVEALPPLLAEAILEGAVLAGSTALPEALTQSSVKPLAKSAKKALYRLRSKGVAVAEAPRPAPEPTRAPEPEALSCLVTSITTDGKRGLILGRILRGSGIEAAQVIFSDELGVVELTLNEVTRSSYRRRIKEATEPQYAIEISREEAVKLLGEATALNLSSRTPFPQDLEPAMRHYGAQPSNTEPTVPPPEPEDVKGVMEGHTLHETLEISAWLPPEAEMYKVVEKMEEIARSPLALSGAQREEQTLQAVRSMARAFFTPERRKLYGLRLWRMAEFFERTDRADAARVARSEARRLFHGPEEPFSRFAERLFEKVIHLSGATAAAPGAPGAGASPQAASPAPASLERRSPGGLILP